MQCIRLHVLDTKVIGELSRDIRFHGIAVTPEYKRSEKYSKSLSLFRDCKVNLTTSDVIRAVTREATPEGIIVEINTPKLLGNDVVTDERILFLYRISDPGNLGTLMRTALAFEWNRIVLLDDCVDPFNPECIRSSMGAALKLKLHSIKSSLLKEFIESNNIKTFIADIADSSFNKGNYINTHKRIGLVLGSEANGFKGFPSDLYNQLEKISIKMTKDVESLNVAVCGGILMNKLNL